MMKIALFLAIGMVAVFNSPVLAEKLTEQDGQELLDALKAEVAEKKLQCSGVESYCSQNSPSLIPKALCPKLLKAHLCDNLNTAAGVNKILEEFASSKNNDKNKKN